jgi:hypothetical protein
VVLSLAEKGERLSTELLIQLDGESGR